MGVWGAGTESVIIICGYNSRFVCYNKIGVRMHTILVCVENSKHYNKKRKK